MKVLLFAILILWTVQCHHSVEQNDGLPVEERRTLATDVVLCKDFLELLNDTYGECVDGSPTCNDDLLTVYTDLNDCMAALESDAALPPPARVCSYSLSIGLSALFTILGMMGVGVVIFMAIECVKWPLSDKNPFFDK